MIRLNVVVEGPTEREFVDGVLAPYLRGEGIHTIHSIPVGGGGSFGKALRAVRNKVRTDSSAYCTTMFDYYGLPPDYPGLNSDDCPPSSQLYDRIECLEKCLAQEIGDTHRFIPYLQIHEFEALLFADVEVIGKAPRLRDTADRRDELQTIVTHFDNPEWIDDGKEAAPSKRLQDLFPRYDKVFHGARIAQTIGLPRIRSECRHFDEWVSRLESLDPLAS
jgi:hypothetical protein